MAVKPVTVVTDANGVVTATWLALSASDTGDPVALANFPDKTAQVAGDATTVNIQGSNDGTNYVNLNDPDGAAIALVGASNGLAMVRENPLYIRPLANGGTDTDVILVGYRSR